MRTTVTAVLVFLFLLAQPVHSATRYVSYINGLDTNPGTEAAPYRTPQFAAQAAQCGDTILIVGGNDYWLYNAISTQGNPVVSCTEETRVTVKSLDPNNRAILTVISFFAEKYWTFENIDLHGNYPTIPGATINIAGGFQNPVGEGAGYLNFINMDVHGNNSAADQSHTSSIVDDTPGGVGHNKFIGGRVHHGFGNPAEPSLVHCFYMETNYNLIDGVEIDHCDGYGIHNNSSGEGFNSTPSYNVYRNNFIHHNGKDTATVGAILLNTGSHNEAYNNIVAWNTNGVGTGAIFGTGQKFYNNTIAFNGVAGSGADEGGCTVSGGTYCDYPIAGIAANDSEFRNNILWGNRQNTISNTGSNTVVSNNICTSGAAPLVTCTITANPNFVNAGGSFLLELDFDIPTGSNAKNAGVTIAGVTSDYRTTSRPQGAAYDIGAFEFIEAGSNQAPNGVIDLPIEDVTITENESVTFAGTGTDPDNNTPLTYLWDFGDGGPGDNTTQNPGSIAFPTAGTYVVTFTVTDSLSLADPTPDTMTVTVNSAPTGCSSKADAFAGTGSLGSSWTRQNNTSGATAARVSGAAVTTSSNVEVPYYCNAVSLANDQYSEIVVSTMSAQTQGVTVRASGTTSTTFNGYVAFVSSTLYYLGKYVNGQYVDLSMGSTTVTSGDTIRLTVSGSLLTLAKNGGTLVTAQDTSHTSGYPGISFYSDGTSVGILSWAADDASPPVPPITAPNSRGRFRR